ncbi:MAG TPA: potassium-transporting ATPase subunit KdpA [Acidimicrobiia bacterium]|jgi:K+-transporting ATPase ATPase A chain|nr:potassium-transporting ATPase subunit KdpA [Acidimicrobiia bacterium]
MTLAGWGQFLALVLLLALTAPPLGRYIAHVYEGAPSRLDRVFGPVERWVYRICRIDPEREQRWNVYALSLLAFSVVGVLLLYVMQRVQGSLGFNPTDMANVTPALSFNTAVSFVTNTNWQSYAGETTLSHFSQMVGLTVQNFVSAAVGMAVMVALIRGLARAGKRTLGNFWVDLVRTCLRILLPIAFVFAIVLIATGVIQNLHGFTDVHTVAGATQKIPGGPVASQESIKLLGTNGGGFFNVNSAHPFENPTKLSDFLEIYSIALIPFALAFTFGRMVKDKRQGYAVVAVMAVLWFGAAVTLQYLETGGNSALNGRGVTQAVTATSPGGNLEGKDLRNGAAASALWGSTTTGTSNGSVNSMHDSFTASGGLVAMVNMKLGEMSPGGVGVGLNGLLVMAILAVFIAGLMVGRTPEYLGKKIQAADVKLVAIYILVMPLIVLGFTAGSVFVGSVKHTSIFNPGAHGFSELLYAFTSAGNNNGSAFAGLTANTAWLNSTLGIAMLFGRFFLIIPTLALAGSLVRKQRVPPSAGTFPTHTPLFVVLVIGVILVVGALTFLPALALGPIVEQLKILH